MMEIIVVMVMIALIAAWSIPQYGRALSRARARNAIQNLTIIHAANVLYRARNSQNCSATTGPGNVCSNLAGINGMNGANTLNITASGVNYACANDANTCTATVGTALVTVNLNNAIADGTNPSCNNQGGASICP